jgi:plasmid stability protein
MATLTIRWTDEAHAAFAAAAAAVGLSAEQYARDVLSAAASSPAVKARYVLRAVGPDDAHAHIRRETDGVVGRGLGNASQAQHKAYKTAIDLVGRNAPGDRERAVSLLQAEFDDVFEV